MYRSLRALLMLLAVLGTALGISAQTTGRLSGTARNDDAGLPGVRVTISSPSLQGTRTAVTDINGNYTLGALPSGTYSVRFEMDGLETVTKTVDVTLSGTSGADAQMRVASVNESVIVVSAGTPATIEEQTVAASVSANLVEMLPVNRTQVGAATLAPGVNENGPNGMLMISGAGSADNLYLVNGAVVNETTGGPPHELFIEDAILETTVQAAGVSAEYGRFLGGVVSVVTRSGGNEFNGSFRDSISNDAWTANMHFVDANGLPQPEALDELNHTFEATFGGFVLRDRLWFFAAGRHLERASNGFLHASSIAYPRRQEQLRLEGKLTGAITQKHSVVASYIDVDEGRDNVCFIACYEKSNIDPHWEVPNDILVLQYNGILSDRFLLEASYSAKNFAYEDVGGDSRDLVEGTWGQDLNTGAFFGAPVFCSVCPAQTELRDNEYSWIKGTYYLATQGTGTHNIVAGYEDWAELRRSNVYQSGSDFALYVYTSPQRAADGSLLVTIAPGDYLGWFPIERLSDGSDFSTRSFYVNDKWDFDAHWSFNLGVRYDLNDGVNSSGETVADDSLISPRIGVSFDVRGDGRFRISGTYGKYVNRIADTVGETGSPAGSPGAYYYFYQGPHIGPLPTFQAFEQAFAWFNSVGGTDNEDLLAAVSLPFTEVIGDSLDSPNLEEWTVGFGTQFGIGGFVRLDYVDRQWHDFFVLRKDTTTGTVEDSLGQLFDLGFVENSDAVEQQYRGILGQGNWRRGNFSLGASYTWSKTRGNAFTQSGVSARPDSVLAYPEYKAFPEHRPVGYYPHDQRHRLRAWMTYDLATPLGNFNFSVLERFDSATAYSAVGDVRTSWMNIENPGYLQPPDQVRYYFSGFGELRWDDITATDLAVNYSLSVKGIQLFLQPELRNVFDEQGQINGNTTVLTAAQSCRQGVNGPTPGARCLPFNPLTDTPIEGIHWQKGPIFGKPTTPSTASSRGSFQQPRTFLLSAGVRF